VIARPFPIGATGLPIVFKKGDEVAPEVDGKPGRRPSPIWFRPVGEGSNWQLASFAFAHRYLPDDITIWRRLRRRVTGPPLTASTDDARDAAKAWLAGQPRPTP
jgi:hypothetical protein